MCGTSFLYMEIEHGREHDRTQVISIKRGDENKSFDNFPILLYNKRHYKQGKFKGGMLWVVLEDFIWTKRRILW